MTLENAYISSIVASSALNCFNPSFAFSVMATPSEFDYCTIAAVAFFGLSSSSEESELSDSDSSFFCFF